MDLPEEDDDGIVLDVPDLKGFEEEKEEDDERLVQGSDAWEAELRRRKAESEKVFGEGEALFAAGDYDGAGEKYLDSAALYGANWRPWFGVVRVQTKDFTDFAGIYDCENAYERAFKRMAEGGTGGAGGKICSVAYGSGGRVRQGAGKIHRRRRAAARRRAGEH